ncbi:hypothetical protein D3C77_456930 [compost metagenome]
MDAREKDELRRKINLLDVDGKTFKNPDDKRKSSYSGTFMGNLVSPDDGPRAFEATSVRISESDWYRATGNYGVGEWIVLNVRPAEAGKYEIITFDEWSSGKVGVLIGGFLKYNIPLSSLQGTITIDVKSSDAFKVSSLNCEASIEGKKYSFSNGEVSIKKIE